MSERVLSSMPEFADLASALGLEAGEAATGEVTLARHGRSFALEPRALEGLGGGDARARYERAWALWGIRFGLDLLEGPTPRASEPPTRFARKVVRYQEVPSVYGDRLMMLFPTLARKWCERVAGTPIYHRPWLTPQLEVWFVEEGGRTFDILTAEAAEAHPDLEKLESDARHALFYEAYRVRPVRRHDCAAGQIRVYETGEGHGASRALLLPEYDYDAAREDGFFAVPSRDVLLVAQPERPQDRPALRAELAALTRTVYDAAPYPLSRALFGLGANDVRFEAVSDDLA